MMRKALFYRLFYQKYFLKGSIGFIAAITLFLGYSLYQEQHFIQNKISEYQSVSQYANAMTALFTHQNETGSNENGDKIKVLQNLMLKANSLVNDLRYQSSIPSVLFWQDENDYINLYFKAAELDVFSLTPAESSEMEKRQRENTYCLEEQIDCGKTEKSINATLFLLRIFSGTGILFLTIALLFITAYFSEKDYEHGMHRVLYSSGSSRRRLCLEMIILEWGFSLMMVLFWIFIFVIGIKIKLGSGSLLQPVYWTNNFGNAEILTAGEIIKNRIMIFPILWGMIHLLFHLAAEITDSPEFSMLLAAGLILFAFLFDLPVISPIRNLLILYSFTFKKIASALLFLGAVLGLLMFWINRKEIHN